MKYPGIKEDTILEVFKIFEANETLLRVALKYDHTFIENFWKVDYIDDLMITMKIFACFIIDKKVIDVPDLTE